MGNEGINFIKQALNADNSFNPIDYFVFGNFSNTNQVNVYQYTKEDVINHIVNGNYNISKSGQIGVKNLQVLKPKILTINFPQFVKTKRNVYKFNKQGIKQNNIDLITKKLVLTIKNKQGKIVSRVFRTFEPINYYVESEINLNKKLELEAINQAVLKDINYFTNIPDFKFMDELKKYSDLKSKELFVLSSKISEKGREKGIKNLFGGRGETINPVVIQNIRKNPARFFKNMFEIYGCDKNGVNKIENAINQVFGIEVELPIAQYCTTNKVVEMVNNIFDIIVEQNKKSL